jgi:acid phosphatase (class A)
MLLPPPPADGTARAKAERAELHAIEKARTPEALAHAKGDDAVKDASIFAIVMGDSFDLKKLPATAKMFADVRAEEKRAADTAKKIFKRNRPWIGDDALKSCSKEDEPQTSYPSGHATMGYSMAVVLAHIAPEKGQAIMARAAEYAEARLVCGVHFRSDIEGGQALGTAVALELMNNPAFKAEYDAAVTELRGAKLASE